MASRAIPIPKGALFTVSSGAYSDYRIMGVFRALEEIDMDALRNTWLTKHPEQREEYSFKDDDFFIDCAKRGLFEGVESWEWFLTAYSKISEMAVYKTDKFSLTPE